MNYAKNILETIGNTPLVRLNTITKEIPALVLAKVESFNPGNSVKDRMALKMVEDAEADGRLKPGGVIIEGTSGNTGMGLALAAIVKGYKLICVSNDKQSKEKFDVLRAMGAQVVVCPTAVAPDDPRSYYSVSKSLADETPNSWYVNQYDNPSNSVAHYEQTGPEIWNCISSNQYLWCIRHLLPQTQNLQRTGMLQGRIKNISGWKGLQHNGSKCIYTKQ